MSFRAALVLVICVFAGIEARAQVDPSLVGTCETGMAEAYLDVNNVRARLLNNGVLFWRGSPNVYEVPKGLGLDVIFSDGLWVGGMVDGELRVSGSTYGPFEFWPGPFNPEASPQSGCSEYDRIWSFSSESDIHQPYRNTISKDVLEWPVNVGAPYIDATNNPGYQPHQGDRPLILGDQMHWWIMNDAGNLHNSTETNPLGIEVQVFAYAFRAIPTLENTTFYKYQITNKNTVPISEMWVGMFADVDLGAAFDDYVGTDTTLSLVYSYNADNDDDDNYGLAPPAIGFATIEVSHSEGGLPSDQEISDAGDFLTNSMGFNSGGGIQGDPGNGKDMYMYLTSRWKNGAPLTIGGNGFEYSPVVTKYMYPGNPTNWEYWTELNTGDARANAPADKRTVLSYGPVTLKPEESVTMTYAYIWARGNSNLDSVTKLKEATHRIQSRRDILANPSPRNSNLRFVDANPPQTPQQSFWLDPPFPNPSNGRATIKYSLSLDGPAEVTVFDVLSRKVATLHSGIQTAGPHETSFDTSHLPPGIYTIRFQSNRNSASQQITVVR